MLLHKAKEFAEETAGQSITDAVIVVPGFFNQAERRAFINAVNLGGLKVLQLINDYTAGNELNFWQRYFVKLFQLVFFFMQLENE